MGTSSTPPAALPPANRHTRVIHEGEPRTHSFDSMTPPLVLSATYSFKNTAELIHFMEGRSEREEYGRYGNPTVKVVESKIAQLDGAEACAVFSSGMAAITSTVIALTRSGSHVVLFGDCYRRTRQFVTQMLSRFGVTYTLVPPGDIDAVERAILPETRLVIGEAPTNPYLHVTDLEALAKLCAKKRVHTLIDATFATPINMRPLEFGATLVTHSATKYLAGHNDVLGGSIAGPSGLVSLIRETRDIMGGICDPQAAYLIHRGLKTLALRVAAQNSSALELARFLEAHPRIEQVWYPGLPSHQDHAVASRLMSGFGGVVTFRVKGDLESTGHFIDRCQIPKIAASLGGVESLIEQPALMSYFGLTTADREALGIYDNLVRYAVGIENTQDLIADLSEALL